MSLGSSIMNFSFADKLSVMPESTNMEEETASHASDGDKGGDKKPAAQIKVPVA